MMNKDLVLFLGQLRAYGLRKGIPNVTETVGRFLNMLIQIKKPRMILEIGCANGYSTIWMAEAAKGTGAKIHTIDFSTPSMVKARENLEKTGFSDTVETHLGDALEVIPRMRSDLTFDFVFVDGQKSRYPDFWHVIQNRLAPEAVIVFDDMMAFPKKTKVFSDLIAVAEKIKPLLIPMDGADGVLMIIKQ